MVDNAYQNRLLLLKVSIRNISWLVIYPIGGLEEQWNSICHRFFVSMHLWNQTHHCITNGIDTRNQRLPWISIAPGNPFYSYFKPGTLSDKKMQHISGLICILIYGVKYRCLSTKSKTISTCSLIHISMICHQHICTWYVIELGTNMKQRNTR